MGRYFHYHSDAGSGSATIQRLVSLWEAVEDTSGDGSWICIHDHHGVPVAGAGQERICIRRPLSQLLAELEEERP